MTWRELIYMITDITKQISDDSQFNEDHIKFLCGKYRNYILNSQYSTHKKSMSDANYQTIRIALQPDVVDICPNEAVLKSVEEIPFTMAIGEKTLYPVDYFGRKTKLVYTDFNRFPYAGNNFTHSTIYASIGPDNHLYIKSMDENFFYLEAVEMRALFNDIDKIALLESESCGCDIEDVRFPLEDAWIDTLINLVVTDLVRGIYQLRDVTNDAADSADQLALMIQRFTNQSFKNLMNSKKIQDAQSK